MSHDKELSLYHQLIDARQSIIAQLNELSERSVSGLNSARHLPPDYASLIAKLEQQLIEIEELLRAQ